MVDPLFAAESKVLLAPELIDADISASYGDYMRKKHTSSFAQNKMNSTGNSY